MPLLCLSATVIGIFLSKKASTLFSDKNSLLTVLDQKHLHTFVVDHKFLIIIFEPYCVGGCGDGPFVVKIPYEHLREHWDSKNPFVANLEKVISSQPFTSSWEQGEWICREEEGGKIESSQEVTGNFSSQKF